MPNLPGTETNTGLPFPWWQIPSRKEQYFVLIGIDNYSGNGFAFPCTHAPTKITISGLTGCLIHCHSIPYSIASDEGTYFTAEEVQEGTHVHEIHWYYHVLYHAK